MFDAPCLYCEYDEPLSVRGIFPEHREIDAVFCCEAFREEFTDWMDWLSAEEFRTFWRVYFKARDRDAGSILQESGMDVRRVIHDSPYDAYTLDFNLKVRKLDKPGDQARARAWVQKYHRHNSYCPAGWKFGLSIWNGRTQVGTAWIARPAARKVNHFTTLEVSRVCVRDDLHPHGLVWNACSQLYAAAAREAERMGYSRIQTYTLVSEDGTTLRAAGWRPEPATSRKGQTWNVASRSREEKAPTEQKIRWTRELRPPRKKAEHLARLAEAARAAKEASRGQQTLWETVAA